MKRKNRVYLLYFVYEFEDGHEDIILLGVFSSKKHAKEALLNLQTHHLFSQVSKYLSIDEAMINHISWKEGFVTI